MKKLSILFFLCAACHGADFEKFAKAIHQTETSGKLGAIVGDAGKALGPLQIHKVCWLDVQGKVGGKYEDCAGLDYSKRVLFFYCQRYAPQALKEQDWQSCARLWNSGPGWKSKKNKTDSYWNKVKKNL